MDDLSDGLGRWMFQCPCEAAIALGSSSLALGFGWSLYRSLPAGKR